MNWLLLLYPAPWRARYGDEFAAVLSSQRITFGLALDVIGGAIDAHLYPQVQNSQTAQIQRGDKMTLSMLQRCSVGGPKLTPGERKTAAKLSIFGALAMAILYLVLTKIYHGAPAVQALLYTSICSSFVYQQLAYLRNRPSVTKVLIAGAELSAVYVFMLAVCLIAARL